MANYFNQHLTRMESMVVIPKSDLQKGMIIRNKYQTIDDGLKEYFFFTDTFEASSAPIIPE